MDGNNFWIKRLDLDFAKPGCSTSDPSVKVTPVIIYFYEENGTVKWKVANSVHDDISFRFDEDAGRIILSDLRQNDKYGYFWLSKLIPDFTIINDTGYDLELNDITFRSPAGDDESLWASARLRIVSTSATDVHYCGVVQQINGRYRVFQDFEWLDEYGTIYVGRQQSGSVIIRSDTDIEKPEDVSVTPTAEGYVIAGLKLNANKASLPTTEHNTKLRFIWYEGIELEIVNHTVKALIIDGIEADWIDDSDDACFDNVGAVVTVKNLSGGSLRLKGEVNAERFEAYWLGTAGDFILDEDAVLRTRTLTVENAREMRGTSSGGGKSEATVWLMSGDAVSLSATGDISLRLNVLLTFYYSENFIDRLEAGGDLYAKLGLYESDGSTEVTSIKDFFLGSVRGKNVTLDLAKNVNLLDDDETGALDIVALQDLTIYTRSIGLSYEHRTFGTAENPLEIKAGGKLIIAQHDDDPLKPDSEATYSLYLHVPEGDLDMSQTDPSSALVYKEWCAVVISVPNGSLKIGSIGYYIDELTLSAGGDVITGALVRGEEDVARRISAGGSITVGAPEYVEVTKVYHDSIIEATDSRIQPETIGFVLTAGGDVHFEGKLTLLRGLSVTAGGDIVLDAGAELKGRTELTAGGDITATGDMSATHVLTLLADGVIALGGELSDKGYTTLKGTQGVTVAGRLNAEAAASLVDGLTQALYISSGGDIVIGCLTAHAKPVTLVSAGGNVILDGFGFAETQASLLAPAGAVYAGLSAQSTGWNYAKLQSARLLIEAQGDIGLATGNDDASLDITGDSSSLILRSKAGIARIGDLSAHLGGAATIEITGDAVLRSYFQSIAADESTGMSITAGGDLTMDEYLSYGLTALSVQGAFEAGLFKLLYGSSSVRAHSIAINAAENGKSGALLMQAADFVDFTTLSPCGLSTVISAQRQRGTISVLDGSIDTMLSFTVEEGDIRITRMQLNGLSNNGSWSPEEIREALKTPTVLLRAGSGSLLVGSISANDDVNLLLDAALDIGSADTPLKLTAYSGQSCLAQQTHTFLWGRSLYLEYNYVLNNTAGDTIHPVLNLAQSDGDREVHLGSYHNPVMLVNKGSLSGSIHSNAPISVTSTHGSIGTEETPFETDIYRQFYVSGTVRFSADAAGDVYLHALGNLGPQNIRAGGVVDITIEGMLDVPTPAQGEDAYSVTSLKNDVRITVNGENAHEARNPVIVVNGNTALDTPLCITLSSPNGAVRSGFSGDIELYLIERALSDFYDVYLDGARRVNILHTDRDGESGRLYLDGDIRAINDVAIRTDGSLMLCGSLRSDKGGISAEGENIQVRGGVQFSTGDSEKGALSLISDGDIDFCIMSHVYQDGDKHMAELSLAGDLKLKAYGNIALAALLKDSSTPTARSLMADARGDISLLGELWFREGVHLSTPGNIAFVAYRGSFVDHEGAETAKEIPLSLTAAGDIALSAGGRVVTGFSKDYNDGDAMKNASLCSTGGSVSVAAGEDLSVGTVISRAGNVLISSGSVTTVGSAEAHGKLSITGSEGIEVLRREDGGANLTAAEFAFDTRGTVADDEGGYLILQYTGAAGPVGVTGADCNTVLKLKALDQTGASVPVKLSGTAYADRDVLLITSAAELALALGASAVGNRVTLKKDVTLKRALSLVLAKGVSVTLDLGGNTLTLRGGLTDVAGLSLGGDGTLSIQNGRLQGNYALQPAIFAVSGTLSLLDGAALENLGGGAAALLLGAELHIAAGEKSTRIRTAGATLLGAGEYAAIRMAHPQGLPQELMLGERKLYIKPDGTLADIAAPAVTLELLSELSGSQSAQWRGIAKNSYIVTLTHEDMKGSSSAPVLSAFSLDSFTNVTLTAQQYTLVYEKEENGLWVTLAGAPEPTALGSYRLTVLPNGIAFESGTAQVSFRVLTAGDSGVHIGDATRFVLRDSAEAFLPVPSGMLEGDVIYYQIGSAAPVTTLTFSYADYNADSPSIEVLYTVLRGGALYDGGSFTFTFIDLSDRAEIFINDFTVEYENYTDGQVIPYRDGIVLETPTRVAMTVYDKDRRHSETIAFTGEMIRYYLEPTAYSIWYDTSADGGVSGISKANTLLQPDETAVYSICESCGNFAKDCTCAPGDQKLTAYASHVEYGCTYRCTVAGACQCGECGVTELEKCREIFGNSFALCGDESCNASPCNHRHYEHYYLSANCAFNTERAAYLMQANGGKLNCDEFGFMALHIKGELEATEWEVRPEGVHIAGRGAIDFSEYVSFPSGSSDAYEIRYTLKNSEGAPVDNDGTLAAGSYTASLGLTSDTATAPAGEKTVNITILNEEDFIRFFLYDDTRDQEIGEDAGYSYSKSTDSGTPGVTEFWTKARFAEGVPGTYTVYTIGYEDRSAGNSQLESILFSIDGVEYKPLEELDFRYSVIVTEEDPTRTLYYRMEGSHNGLPVSTTGRFELGVTLISLMDYLLKPDPDDEAYESPITLRYGPDDTMLHACSGQTVDLSEAILYDIPTIAEWGDYKLSPDKLNVVFEGFIPDGGYGTWVTYSGEPGMQLDGWTVERVRIYVKGDEHFSPGSILRDDTDTTLFHYSRLPFGSDTHGENPGSVSFELDGDWQSAGTDIDWDDWRDDSSAYSLADPTRTLERLTYQTGSDDVLLITPDLLDGYSTALFNSSTSSQNASIQSAFAAAGLTRLRWSVVTDYYSYDGVKLGQSSESVNSSGEFDVNADTSAQQLSVSVPGLSRSGVYAVRVLFTGYDDSGSELFTLRGAQAVLTPGAIPASVPGSMEYTYDQRGDAAIPGVETAEFRKDFDVSYAYEPIDPLTGVATGALLDGLTAFPALPGDKLRNTAYRVYVSLSPKAAAPATPSVSPLDSYSAEGAFLEGSWNQAYAQYLDALSQTVSTHYNATTLETVVTIRSIAVTDIRDVSVSGYEGRADGEDHGVTLEGLIIRDGAVQDTVSLTVKDAAGAIVSGFDNVTLDTLTGVSIHNGSVLVPLMKTTNRESYTVSVTVERGEGYHPFTAEASLRLISGDAVKGVNKEHVFDGEAHSIELTGLNGDGADIGNAVVSGWWTKADPTVLTAQPSFTEPGVYTIYFNASRQVLGESEEYSGSATLTILPFDVSVTGWNGDFDGKEHSVALNRIDWANDTVFYNGKPVTGAAELPQFTDAGSHSVTLSVTRGAVTRSLTATVDIRPLTLTGVTANDLIAYGDGSTPFSITVNGVPEGAVITYFDGAGNPLSGNPGYAALGVHTVRYEVNLSNYKTCSGEATIEIRRLEGVMAAGYEGDWDGQEHSIAVYGATPEETIYYSIGKGGAQTQTNPVFVDPGSYTVYYSVGSFEKKLVNGEEMDVWISRAEGSASVVLHSARNIAFDVTGYTGVYDGTEHAAVTITGDLSGLSVQYFAATRAQLDGAPVIKNAGRHAYTVRLLDEKGNVLFTKAVECVIEPKQLDWDTGALALENVVKAYDGNRGITADLGTLSVSGALSGDTVTLLDATGIARLLSDELGGAVPALITFEKAVLDNANYALPGEAAFSFLVRHIPLMEKAEKPDDAVYTGQQLKPAVSLPDLIEGQDYEVARYGENRNVGEGQIYLRGIGALQGASLTVRFDILAAALPAPDAIGQQYFTGAPVLPAPSIPGLVRGRDFTVQYVNNVALGTASVTLTGIGNYTGEQTLTFDIVVRPPELDGPANFQLVTDVNGGTAPYEQQTILLTGASGGQDGSAPRMLLLKALPTQNEAGEAMYEARSLNLSADSIKELIRQGYTTVCFMLGGVALFIDLRTLTQGDYSYTLEPDENGSGEYRLRATLNGVELETLPEDVTLAFVTQDAQAAARGIWKVGADGNGELLDTAYTPESYGGQLPALYTAQTNAAGVYRLSEAEA